MYDAYHRIFARCGLNFRAVEADTGLIGGTSSHEFMVLADTGEETVVYSEPGTYAANVERAEVLPPNDESKEAPRPLTQLSTLRDCRTVEEVTKFLKVTTHPSWSRPCSIRRALRPWPYLIRGDHDANEIKLKRLLGVTDLELAGPATVEKV